MFWIWNSVKLQTKHSLYASTVQTWKKESNTVKSEKSEINMKERKYFAPFCALNLARGDALLHILSASTHEFRRENPPIADEKDNVIAKLTVLSYMMFVSLETSPFERQQGQ